MTLIICAKGKDGMVFASDSRGTFGDPATGVTAQNDTMKKVFRINNNSVLMSAGSGEVGAKLVDDILKVIDINMSVTEVMEQVSRIAKEKYDKWFQKLPLIINPANPNITAPPRPSLGIIIGGYETAKELKDSKIFSLMSQFDFAPFLHDYGFALQGVPQYALYLMNRLYSEDMKIEQLKHLLAYVITETATQDGRVGGPLRMAIINSTETKELSREEVEEIKKQNEENSKRLRSLFYGE